MIKVGIIGSPTIGSPTEIYEILHNELTGKYKVNLIDNEPTTKTFKIEKITNNPELIKLPLTRRERRKQQRKTH